MENIQDKLGAILNNPQMMQQIMSMAQAMGNNSPSQSSAPSQSIPNLDPSMLQKLSGILGNNSVTQEEISLLHALTPFLPKERIYRLEKAMRAAKIAKLASSFLSTGGLQMLGGR